MVAYMAACMLRLKAIINSSVEAIFAAKCCAISDANLEIILTNSGACPISVAGRFWLAGVEKTEPLNLYPQGVRTLAPGEGASFYGTMDPQRWTGYRTMTVMDTDGHRHAFDLHHDTD